MLAFIGSISRYETAITFDGKKIAGIHSALNSLRSQVATCLYFAQRNLLKGEFFHWFSHQNNRAVNCFLRPKKKLTGNQLCALFLCDGVHLSWMRGADWFPTTIFHNCMQTFHFEFKQYGGSDRRVANTA